MNDDTLIIHNKDGSTTVVENPFIGMKALYDALADDPAAVPELCDESREAILREVNCSKRFDIEDMRFYADKHRGKFVTSGPHWPLVLRFPVLFDEYVHMHSKAAITGNRLLVLSNFLRHIMTLGLLRGSARLTKEALRILDDVEALDIEGSRTQNL